MRLKAWNEDVTFVAASKDYIADLAVETVARYIPTVRQDTGLSLAVDDRGDHMAVSLYVSDSVTYRKLLKLQMNIESQLKAEGIPSVVYVRAMRYSRVDARNFAPHFETDGRLKIAVPVERKWTFGSGATSGSARRETDDEAKARSLRAFSFTESDWKMGEKEPLDDESFFQTGTVDAAWWSEHASELPDHFVQKPS